MPASPDAPRGWRSTAAALVAAAAVLMAGLVAGVGAAQAATPTSSTARAQLAGTALQAVPTQHRRPHAHRHKHRKKHTHASHHRGKHRHFGHKHRAHHRHHHKPRQHRRSRPVAPETVTPSVPGPVIGEPVSLRIVQANIFSGLRPARFAADLREVAQSRPDFITLNEQPRRSDAMITPPGYAVYRSMADAHTAETPVLWRTDRWEKIGSGTRYLSTRQVKWGVRAVNYATLRHVATGRVVSVISAHPAPTVRATQGLLEIFMTGLGSLARELDKYGDVLVGGDLNVGYNKPAYPRSILEAADLVATYDLFGKPAGGTGDHYGATIDYVLFQRNGDLVPKAQGKYELFSDHDAVWADFLLGGSAS